MNRSTHSLLVRSLLAAALLPYASALHAATIVVDDDGSGDYDTISEAVNNAQNGDVIIVLPGNYQEEVIVDVSVTIAGSGTGATIVTPATSNPGTGPGSQVTTTTWVFRIQADDVTISGLTVNGNNPALSAGIDARGGIITDFSTGTYSGLTVLNCEVLHVRYRGIYAAAGGIGHSFVANTVRDVKGNFLDSVGIFFFGAQGEALFNDVENCSVGIGFQSGGGGVFGDNSIRSCDLGILANGSSAAVTIRDNLIEDSDQGVQSIAVNTSVDVRDNSVTGCDSGLVFFGLGSGTHTADGNDIDAQGAAGSSAVFATTDVSPFGFGDLTLTLTDNLLAGADQAVVLHEAAASNAPVLDCTLSSDPGAYNTFTANLSFNVFLQDCNDDIDATHNFWGAVSPALIELALWHQPDDAALGLIDFSSTVNLLVTVDDDGPADFTSINPAVQSLLPGGTVLVKPGLYVEDVVIDRSCLIQGSGTDPDPALGSILRGASIHPDLTVVSVTADDVVLTDLRVDGQQLVYDQARRAVYAANVAGLTVTDCVIHTATSGIAYVTSSSGTFLRNEVYDFGFNLNNGGGIFIWGSTAVVGTDGNGNLVHDGLATGIIFHAGSNGTGSFNLVYGCPLGYLSNGASGLTLYARNEARNCDQGYQAIGNGQPVDFVENSAFDCRTGFTLFSLGAQLHTYTDNLVRHRLGNPGSAGLFFTTESAFGDDDLNAVVRGTVICGAAFGVVLDESVSSMPFAMNADLAGGTGANWISGALNQDLLLQMCDDDIDASGNYFGSTDPLTVEGKITHQIDDAALGLVDFSALLAPSPDIRRRGEGSQGREISIVCTGAPGDLTVLLFGTTQANIGTPFGTLLVNPFTIAEIDVVQPSGLEFTEAVQAGPIPAGLTIYLQGIVGGPGTWMFTDLASVTTY